MAKKSQTEELGDLILKHRPDTSVADAFKIARALVRDAKALGRLGVEECNRELTRREREQIGALVKRVQDNARAINVLARHNGDPRGYAVKLHFGPDKRTQPGNTWGGTDDGWGIG